MSDVTPQLDHKIRSLSHFPVTLFGGSLGMFGLGLAWREASRSLYFVSSQIGEGILGCAFGLFIASICIYAAKSFKHFGAVKEELAHPVRGNFFAAIGLSILLLSIAITPYARDFGEAVWWTGAIVTLFFTLLRLGLWFNHSHDLKEVNPSWFIPVVGNIVSPIGAMAHGYQDIGWFFFGVGFFFWIFLATLMFSRAVLYEMMTETLRPTYYILLAPPAVGVVAYTALNHGYFDSFSKMLFGFALFISLMLLLQIKRILPLPFALPWWSFSFPNAAFCLSGFLYYQHSGEKLVAYFILGLLGVTTLVVSFIFIKTLQAFINGTLFRAPAS